MRRAELERESAQSYIPATTELDAVSKCVFDLIPSEPDYMKIANYEKLVPSEKQLLQQAFAVSGANIPTATLVRPEFINRITLNNKSDQALDKIATNIIHLDSKTKRIFKAVDKGIIYSHATMGGVNLIIDTKQAGAHRSKRLVTLIQRAFPKTAVVGEEEKGQIIVHIKENKNAGGSNLDVPWHMNEYFGDLAEAASLSDSQKDILLKLATHACQPVQRKYSRSPYVISPGRTEMIGKIYAGKLKGKPVAVVVGEEENILVESRTERWDLDRDMNPRSYTKFEEGTNRRNRTTYSFGYDETGRLMQCEKKVEHGNDVVESLTIPTDDLTKYKSMQGIYDGFVEAMEAIASVTNPKFQKALGAETGRTR